MNLVDIETVTGGVLTVEPFEACWQRLDRAIAHHSEASAVWNEFIEEHPYDFSLDNQGNGIFVLRVHQLRPVPSQFALLIGEWLYNLRSALDYIIWATAVHTSGSVPPRGEGVLQYPVYESQDAWTKNLFRLKPLAQHHRDMLEQMQPYNSLDPDANYLGWINRLARIDRHRRLNITTAHMAELNPVFGYPADCKGVLQFGDRVLTKGEASIARLTLTPWQDGWDVKVNPRVGLDPEIADWANSPFWSKIPWNRRFPMIHASVTGEIAIYEYDCTGSSRGKQALTDSYREECDARRRPVEIVTERPETRWGPAQPGKPASTSRFEGADFPPHGPGSSSGR